MERQKSRLTEGKQQRVIINKKSKKEKTWYITFFTSIKATQNIG